MQVQKNVKLKGMLQMPLNDCRKHRLNFDTKYKYIFLFIYRCIYQTPKVKDTEDMVQVQI